MSMSRRAARMQRAHKRNKQGGGLNLTALMDIFTILVFFLMVNQSEVTVQSSDDIKLPASLADTQPDEQVTILLTKTSILVRRSEERRVGKECRSRWWPDQLKKKYDKKDEDVAVECSDEARDRS